MQFRFIFNVSGHFHAWPVLPLLPLLLLLLMRPQGISLAEHSTCFDSCRNYSQQAKPSRLGPPGRQFTQLPHVSCSCHPFGQLWPGRAPRPGQARAKYMDINEAHTFLLPPSRTYDCRTKNNNFSADVIFISTYVAAFIHHVCVCVCT